MSVRLARGLSYTLVVATLMFGQIIPSVALAQGSRGTISGVVTDQNGAVVAGATVKLVNIAKQQEIRTVQTNSEGVYQVLEVEPAVYELTITASGFAEKTIKEVRVEPNRNIQLDSSLSLTGATEQITVSAGTEMVERQSVTLGTTVEHRRVEGLPLNGRNVLDLALLQPGVVGTAGAGSGFRVNGARNVENNIQLDGSNNNEIAVGGSMGAQPRPDAVEEFRLLTSNYDAEFGRNSGSIINVVTKSGSNDFHGNLRFFYRPTFLSAARFFDQNRPGAKPLRGTDDFRRRFERKEGGGNFGGPFFLPKIYNGKEKTFFFVDYERRGQLIGDTRTITAIPTLAERSGQFNRTITDPATGLPFPGNRIPTNRFSPIALFYIGFLPVPDSNGVANSGADDIVNNDYFTTRVDHVINRKQAVNFTFSFFNNKETQPFAFGGSTFPGFGELDKDRTFNYVVRHTYSISSNLINSFLAAYARNNFPSVLPQNSTTPAEIGFTANFVANNNFAGPPRITFNDRGLNLGNTIQGPQARVSENFQLQDSVSWARGNHRFKFGVDGTLYKQDQTFLFINQGILTFSGRFGLNTTGDDFADFLIGNSPVAQQYGANGERDFRQRAFSSFGQDTWRVSDSLTLSLGLRWEYTSPLTDKFDRVAYYRTGAVSQLLTSGALHTLEGVSIKVPAGSHAPVGLVYVGDPDPVLGGTVPRGGVKKDWNNFAPRIGVAWSPGGHSGTLGRLLGERQTVIRAGWGVTYGAIIGDTALQQLSAPGFNGTNAFFFPASGTLADPFAPDPFPAFGGNQGQVPNPFLQSQTLVGAPLTQFSRATDPRIRTPYTYQYNLTVERSFHDNYVASLSYVGNRGVKLYALEQINEAVGTFFPTPAGRTIPTPTNANANSRRINNDVQLGVSQMVSAGNSWYNALEANIQKRYHNGLLFQVAYTYSKSIADSDQLRNELDRIDRRFGKSLSINDVPHRLVASWIYDLPVFRGQHGIGGKVLGGWSLGGIATFQSGTPFSVANLFDTVGSGGGVLSLADLGAAFQNIDPRKNDSRAFNADAFKAFGNTAAPESFNIATQFRRGTQGFNQARLRNGINNWDFILAKKTRLWSETTGLELRFEAFNAFNHTQFTTVDTNLRNIVLVPGTTTIDPLKSSFGKFTAARESRIIQLGARFSF